MWITLFLACLPKTATVSVVGVQARTVRADGSDWDGLGHNAQALSQLASPMLDLDPATKATLLLVQGTLVAMVPPDIFGNAQLGAVTLSLPEISDSYLPFWCQNRSVDQCPSFEGVFLKESPDLILKLADADLLNHDPIATLRISRDDLIAAYRSHDLYVYDASTQGTGDILYVYLWVTRP